MVARSWMVVVVLGALSSLGAQHRTRNFVVEAPTPQIAQRLGELELAEGDMLARLSGDEFALCLFDTQIDAAERLAWRLRSSLERPLVVQDQTVDVGAGVGIALYPQHGRDADSLLGRAEVAMYVAKTRQSGVQVYSPELDAASSQSLSLVSDLRQAIANDDLRMYLQPKIDLRNEIGRAHV